MQPELDVFGLSVKTFGLCFAAGFLVAGAIIARRMRELGRPEDDAYGFTFSALIGGLVGARLYWVAENWSEAKGDLLGTLFSGSGLVWYGGLVGGAVGVLLWAWRRKFLGLTLLDVAAVPLMLGYGIGRIGCQVSGDGDYGGPSDLPWAMGYPNGTVPTTPGEQVHPTPLYETLATGLAAWFLWRRRDAHRPGVLFALYLVIAGLERFLVEFVRRNEVVLAGLTAPQFQSIALVALGAAGLVWALRRAPAAGNPA